MQNHPAFSVEKASVVSVLMTASASRLSSELCSVAAIV
jgi:hypothetical protein